MKNIKKIAALTLIGAMTLVLGACNSNSSTKTSTTTTTGETKITSSTTTDGKSNTSDTNSTTTTTVAATTATTSGSTEATTLAVTTPTRKVDGEKIFFRDLDLMKADGTTDKLSGSAKKYTVVCFWQTEYPICIDQLSVLESLAADEAEIVSVIMINTGESKEKLESFAKERSSNLTFYLDEDGSIAKDNQVTRLPYLMFLTEDLEVMGTVGGKINRNDFNVIFDKIDEFRANRGE
ncbi:MAG: TlpA disulfide reductase family protein [Bacillota bacterium]|nr:TlpA disulfide reductase family protein [Bacillota bacterium]